MSDLERFHRNADVDLPGELKDLASGLAACTLGEGAERAAVRSAFGRVVDMVMRRRRILSLVQEALSQLRLDVKYLMFDLEATRRERDELKSRLEELERNF